MTATNLVSFALRICRRNYAGRCILRILAFSKTMRTSIVVGTYGLTGDICRPPHLVVSKKADPLPRIGAHILKAPSSENGDR